MDKFTLPSLSWFPFESVQTSLCLRCHSEKIRNHTACPVWFAVFLILSFWLWLFHIIKLFISFLCIELFMLMPHPRGSEGVSWGIVNHIELPSLVSSAKFSVQKGKIIKTKQTPRDSRIFPSKELQFFWNDSQIVKAVQVWVHKFVWDKGVIIQNTMFTTPGSCALLHSSPSLSFQNTGANWLPRILQNKRRPVSFSASHRKNEDRLRTMTQLTLHSKTTRMDQWHGLTAQPHMSFPVSAQERAGSAVSCMKIWELR